MMEAETPIAVSLEFCFMLLYQIYNIVYGPSYIYIRLKITPIRGQWANLVCPTVVCRYQLDLCSENELRIQMKEGLLGMAYLSKGVDDQKLWFT